MVVRNLKHSLLNAGPASPGGELVVGQNGDSGRPQKKTRVGVLISGTGVCFVQSFLF